MEQFSPKLVSEDSNTGFKYVKYSLLYLKGLKATQELIEEVENLKLIVTELRAEIDELKNK